MYRTSDSSTWKTIGTKYGTASTVKFTPSAAGNYDILISVKDSSGTVKSFVFTVTVTGTLLENKSTISSTSVSANTAVTITAVAKEGTAPYYYTYEYKKSTNSTWTTIGKRNNTNTSASFTPTEKGEYNARVYIKDASGFVTVKNFNVTVK